MVYGSWRHRNGNEPKTGYQHSGSNLPELLNEPFYMDTLKKYNKEKYIGKCLRWLFYADRRGKPLLKNIATCWRKPYPIKCTTDLGAHTDRGTPYHSQLYRLLF